jgi:hypothetical protein
MLEEEVPAEAAATDPWGDAVTPVPPTAPAGEVLGVPLLVGGADLEDSLATLVAYKGSDAVHEVLYATVGQDAEAKLVEALSLSEEKLVAVVVDKAVDGRLLLDTEHQLFEQLETVAKSVNNHLKAQDAIPPHTLANFEKLAATLQELKAAAPTEAEAQMLDGYLAAAESINQRLKDPHALPYGEGGKVPMIKPHEVSQLVAVTEYVPAPAGEAPENLRAAQMRDATRVAPTLDAAGVASWDGKCAPRRRARSTRSTWATASRPSTGPTRSRGRLPRPTSRTGGHSRSLLRRAPVTAPSSWPSWASSTW